MNSFAILLLVIYFILITYPAMSLGVDMLCQDIKRVFIFIFTCIKIFIEIVEIILLKLKKK